MFERTLARRVGVIGVGYDGANDFFRVAAFAEDFCAFGGMFAVGGVIGVGPALVIEIVQQGGDAPEFFVGTGFAGIGPDAGLDRQHVLAQGFRLREFAN